jgi:long-chain-fatty-acid--[acyl-carrier-protein] ligase
MLFSELHDIKLQPLVDEGFFKIPPIRHVLSLFDAVEVPDLRLSRKGVEQVRQLDAIVQESLTRGDNIIFYPSGHITTDGTEKIGSRHLAYTTCSVLPTHTKVIAIRIRGLWGSRWSRYNRKSTPSIVRLLAESVVLIFSCAILFMRRRTVTFEYIDITDEVSTWTQEGKLPFNRHLEKLYNTES